MQTQPHPLLLIGKDMKQALVGVIAAVALAGCASSVPAPTVTVTATPEVVTPAPAPEPVEPTYTKEELFIKVIEDKYGNMTPSQEQTLIKFAKDTCIRFDAYGVDATLRYYGSKFSGQEARVLGYVIGVGTASWCPQFGKSFTSGTAA